jgi:hypothetical protein
MSEKISALHLMSVAELRLAELLTAPMAKAKPVLNIDGEGWGR